MIGIGDVTKDWTGPEDILARVKRRWTDGSLLRAFAEAEPFPVIDVPLRGPKSSQIGDDLGAVQDWISRLERAARAGTRYELTFSTVGGRHFGRNQLPSRAIVSRYDQAWGALGVVSDARRYQEMVRQAGQQEPVRAWLLAHPLRALELYPEWPALLAAYSWLEAHRGSDFYLRMISAPGVDTKFADRHRVCLAEMLAVPGTAAGFLAGLGLRAKPEFVRMRFSVELGLPKGLSELSARSDELAALALTPRKALICENEITYLSVPVPVSGVVIWGKGFEVDRVGRLAWLTGTQVDYWGDLDTHGFAILNRLRAWLPQTRSILMDRETLLAHRDRWGTEQQPTAAGLSRLTAGEHSLYDELVEDRFGDRVRLEQERVDWGWVLPRLPD